MTKLKKLVVFGPIEKIVSCLHLLAIGMPAYEVFCICRLISCFSLISGNSGAKGRIWTGILLIILSGIGEAWFFRSLAKKIQDHSNDFLLFFQVTASVLTALSFVSTLIISDVEPAVLVLLGSLAGIVFFTVYSVRSAIMMGYMGREEYIKLSLIPGRIRWNQKVNVKNKLIVGSSSGKKTKRKSDTIKARKPEDEGKNSPVIIPAFQKERCCICNGNFEEGYSVLFRSKNGMEARMDIQCRNALHSLIVCESPEKVMSAIDYLSSRMRNVAPIITPYLEMFLKNGAEFLEKERKPCDS